MEGGKEERERKKNKERVIPAEKREGWGAKMKRWINGKKKKDTDGTKEKEHKS